MHTISGQKCSKTKISVCGTLVGLSVLTLQNKCHLTNLIICSRLATGHGIGYIFLFAFGIPP